MIRLLIGFGEKIESYANLIPLYFMLCKYCQVRRTLGVTPMVEPGIADHPFSIENLPSFLEAQPRRQAI
jgi:hypothetical protein